MTAMSTSPAIRDETLVSYGGDKVRTRVVTPVSRDELKAALQGAREDAKEHGRSVTFRAGGHAFDTQSLNGNLVISLDKFTEITVDEATATVTAGAGAQWGQILAKSVEKGMVPYVMVTTHTATAGGTLASNSLSRFSPTLGREGQHVRRFAMMTPSGDVIECSRGENKEYFSAAIAGLGYVGAVLEVTQDLLPLRLPPGDIAVATTFEKVEGLRQIAARLLFHVRQTAHKGEHRTAGVAKALARDNPTSGAWAISVVVYLQKKNVGLLATSHYVQASPEQLHPCVFHSPNSVGAWVLQIAALFPILRAIGYWIVIQHGFSRPANYVDRLEGYTFFEDCNRNLRYFLRGLGFPMGIRQQTYIIPYDPADPESSEKALADFMIEAKALLKDRCLSPTLIDVLYLPDEVDDSFPLSSSRNLPGFAVTFTFEKLLSARFTKVESALRDLVEICHKGFRGRISLVKNVYAKEATVKAMYSTGIAEMRRVREANGAKGLLSNDFMARVLSELL
jgi:FAD/FMN-containing dehydrogenase